MTTIEIDTDGEVGIDRPRSGHRRRHPEVRAGDWRATSAGEIDDDVFKVFRLANGVYGQRQGGTTR